MQGTLLLSEPISSIYPALSIADVTVAVRNKRYVLTSIFLRIAASLSSANRSSVNRARGGVEEDDGDDACSSSRHSSTCKRQAR